MRRAGRRQAEGARAPADRTVPSPSFVQILPLVEVVFVDLDGTVGLADLYYYLVGDQQVGQAGAVDEDYAGADSSGVLGRLRCEAARGDEDCVLHVVAVQGPDERLNRLAANGVVGGVPLGLNIDPLQAQLVLVDDAVDAAVPAAADPPGSPVGAAVTHGHQYVEDRLFEEG